MFLLSQRRANGAAASSFRFQPLAEVPAAHLRTWETRAYELVLGARGAPPVARIACESDCRARYLGIRCGNKVMGERQKAFCHSLRGALHLGRYDHV